MANGRPKNDLPKSTTVAGHSSRHRIKKYENFVLINKKLDQLPKIKPPEKPYKWSPGPAPKITAAVIAKLEHAFSWGCSDDEAILHAGISRALFYEFQKANPAFKERKQLLKQLPDLRGRQAWIAAFEVRPDLAARYLEGKRPDEFNPKFAAAPEPIVVNFPEEAKKRLQAYANQVIDVPATDIRSIPSGPGEVGAN